MFSTLALVQPNIVHAQSKIGCMCVLKVKMKSSDDGRVNKVLGLMVSVRLVGDLVIAKRRL